MRIPVAFASLAIVLATSSAAAQPLGVFRWQLQPYCNVVTLAVTQTSGIYTLHGADDQCGAAEQASIVGTAFLNPDGSIGIGLTTVLAPGGTPVHVDARISLASLGGPWRDSAGNSGTFVFTPGPGTGGSLRPVAPNGVAPGSITAEQLATGSVSGAAIIDGSITTADLSDEPRAAFESGLHSVALTAAHTVVRAVTLTPVTAGQVIVNASGFFTLPFPNPIDLAVVECSISTGTSVEGGHATGALVVDAPGTTVVPFAATRGFAVGAGRISFRFVCRGSNLDGLEVNNTSLTAIFVAGSQQ